MSQQTPSAHDSNSAPAPIHSAQTQQADFVNEVGLGDIVRFFWFNKMWLVLGAILGLGLGAYGAFKTADSVVVSNQFTILEDNKFAATRELTQMTKRAGIEIDPLVEDKSFYYFFPLTRQELFGQALRLSQSAKFKQQSIADSGLLPSLFGNASADNSSLQDDERNEAQRNFVNRLVFSPVAAPRGFDNSNGYHAVRLTHRTKDPKNSKATLNAIVDSINAQVNRQTADNFATRIAAHERGVDSFLARLDRNIANSVATYELTTQQSLAKLRATATIARNLGIAEPIIGVDVDLNVQAVVSENDEDRRLTPVNYLWGYKAIEAEIAAIEQREDPRLYIEALVGLESQRRLVAGNDRIALAKQAWDNSLFATNQPVVSFDSNGYNEQPLHNPLLFLIAGLLAGTFLGLLMAGVLAMRRAGLFSS